MFSTLVPPRLDGPRLEPAQVVVDEVRAAQEGASRRWETEVRSLKELQGKNQKRLFLLEQERDQLRDKLKRASTSSEKSSAQLREAIGGAPAPRAERRSRARRPALWSKSRRTC